MCGLTIYRALPSDKLSCNLYSSTLVRAISKLSNTIYIPNTKKLRKQQEILWSGKTKKVVHIIILHNSEGKLKIYFECEQIEKPRTS